MRPSAVIANSLEFLAEPGFLVARDGRVLEANGAGQRLLGTASAGFDLFEYVDTRLEEFRQYLRRASGSSAPIVGGVVLRTRHGRTKVRLHCARLASGPAAGALVLRCLLPRDDQFSVLQGKVRKLDAELRDRLREKAVLEEALHENRTLLRELQHRVKNNIQMMVTLLQMSAKGRQSDQVREFVDTARSRLQAMASAQDAIQRSRQMGLVETGALLTELLGAIAEGFQASANLRLEIASAYLPSDVAHGLALIGNELLTNAIKHGVPDRRGTIHARFGPNGDGWELAVHDSGPGIPADTTPGSTGLDLVRGLCRQIGGSLAISNVNGARCAVRFKADLDWRPA